jgi:hypothetical protein
LLTHELPSAIPLILNLGPFFSSCKSTIFFTINFFVTETILGAYHFCHAEKKHDKRAPIFLVVDVKNSVDLAFGSHSGGPKSQSNRIFDRTPEAIMRLIRPSDFQMLCRA